MKYCTIEGPSFSGKTTNLTYYSNLGLPTLEEPRVDKSYPELWEKHKQPPGSFEDYTIIIDAYIELECERAKRIAELPASTDLIIADRSILSVLVFEAFASKYRRGNPSDRIRSHDYAAIEIDAAVQAGRIVLPNCVLVLCQNDPREFDRRVNERNEKNAPVANFNIAQFWSNTTYNYARAIFGASAVKYNVPSLNLPRQDAVAEIGEQLLSIMRRLPGNYQHEAVSILQSSF